MAGALSEAVGQRIALRRAALSLSQEAVVGQMAPRERAGEMRGYTREWLSGVESGKTDPSVAQFYELAAVLRTTPGWLLAGDASGDSEFVAAMRGYDEDLDERGRIMLLTQAGAEAQQARTARAAAARSADALSAFVQRLVDAGLSQRRARQIAEQSQDYLLGQPGTSDDATSRPGGEEGEAERQG